MKSYLVMVEMVNSVFTFRKTSKWLNVSEVKQLDYTKRSLKDIVLVKLKKKLKFSDSVRLEINMIVIIGINLNENQSNIALFFHRFGLFV